MVLMILQQSYKGFCLKQQKKLPEGSFVSDDAVKFLVSEVVIDSKFGCRGLEIQHKVVLNGVVVAHFPLIA